jgi:hypothetical protein
MLYLRMEVCFPSEPLIHFPVTGVRKKIFSLLEDLLSNVFLWVDIWKCLCDIP